MKEQKWTETKVIPEVAGLISVERVDDNGSYISEAKEE